MSMSFKASPDGNFGEILVNGQVVAKLPVSGNAVIPNLVGTVSQSGGVPTGAVVERGSNANGEYVRFADGTQFCTVYKIYSAEAALLGNGVYYRSQAWYYPAAFITAPAVTCGAFVELTLSWGAADAQATTANSTFLNALTNVGHSQPVHIRGIAIGRWF